jgi:hypothetical protein
MCSAALSLANSGIANRLNSKATKTSLLISDPMFLMGETRMALPLVFQKSGVREDNHDENAT